MSFRILVVEAAEGREEHVALALLGAEGLLMERLRWSIEGVQSGVRTVAQVVAFELRGV
jgi:hypothetical protein